MQVILTEEEFNALKNQRDSVRKEVVEDFIVRLRKNVTGVSRSTDPLQLMQTVLNVCDEMRKPPAAAK